MRFKLCFVLFYWICSCCSHCEYHRALRKVTLMVFWVIYGFAFIFGQKCKDFFSFSAKNVIPSQPKHSWGIAKYEHIKNIQSVWSLSFTTHHKENEKQKESLCLCLHLVVFRMYFGVNLCAFPNFNEFIAIKTQQNCGNSK